MERGNIEIIKDVSLVEDGILGLLTSLCLKSLIGVAFGFNMSW